MGRGAEDRARRRWNLRQRSAAFWSERVSCVALARLGKCVLGETRSRVFSAYRFIFSFGEAGCAKWVVSAREGQEVSLSAGSST